TFPGCRPHGEPWGAGRGTNTLRKYRVELSLWKMAAQNCARKGGARAPSKAPEGRFNGPGVGSSRPVGSGPDELLSRAVHEHSRTNRFRRFVLPGAPEGVRGGIGVRFFGPAPRSPTRRPPTSSPLGVVLPGRPIERPRGVAHVGFSG